MTEYFESVKPSYIENWPDALMRLSFSTELLPLSPEEVDALVAAYEWQNGENTINITRVATLNVLNERIDKAITHFPRGVFVRLGSRSPKDVWATSLKCTDGRKALEFLTMSERVYDDLQLAVYNNYQPHIAVREWVDIPWHQEFRVLIKDKRIVGVSQYDHFKPYPREDTHEGRDEETIRWVVDTFFADYLKPALHIDTTIADLWIKVRAYDNTRVWETKLIEINPFITWTDPCLFSWRDLDKWSKKEPYEVRLK